MSDYQGNDARSPGFGNSPSGQNPGQGGVWAAGPGADFGNGPGPHNEQPAGPGNAGVAGPAQGGDAGYAAGYAQGLAQARAQQGGAGFAGQQGAPTQPPHMAGYQNAGTSQSAGAYQNAAAHPGVQMGAGNNAHAIPGGYAAGYGPGPGYPPNAQPGLGETMSAFAQGRGSVSGLTRALGVDDADFWKGALVGAAAALLLGSGSIQNALFRNGKGQTGTSD